jgi:hypothetical protein
MMLAQQNVYIDRICSVFAAAMPYKDLPCIWSPSATLPQQLSGEPRFADQYSP